MKNKKLLPLLLIVLTALLFSTGLWFSDRERKSNSLRIDKAPQKNLAKREFITQIPSLEQIFNDDHDWVATLSAERVRVLVATGDVILARSVNYKTVNLSNFRWPFEKTVDVLKNADITLINLESSLIQNCPPINEGMIFCGDPRNVEGLVYAGVDVVTLANNHLGNYGTGGIKTTVDLLNNFGIFPTGISSTVFKDVRALRFAFLGYNDIGRPEPMISWAYDDKIVSEVVEAKKTADVVIVSFHWGVEYTDQPTERQRKFAHLAIDSGADLVIGNHPHWIQPLEIYKGKFIVYSHGNFIFDQMWSGKTREGIVGRYTFFDENLVNVEFLPIQIDDYGQPYFLTGDRKASILRKMRKESIKLSSLISPQLK